MLFSKEWGLPGQPLNDMPNIGLTHNSCPDAYRGQLWEIIKSTYENFNHFNGF